MIDSGAPLARRRWLPSLPTNTDMLFLSLENSYVPSRGEFASRYWLVYWSLFWSERANRLLLYMRSAVPIFSAKTRRAPSVDSPTQLNMPVFESYAIDASLQSAEISAIRKTVND